LIVEKLVASSIFNKFVTQYCISLPWLHVTQVGEAVSGIQVLVLDQLFSGKIRVALLTKLLLNPVSKVYLRGLERDLGVSSNTVRLELNKLQEMHLIQVQAEEANAKVKHYMVNQAHPMFQTLRGIILQFVGLDQIIDQIIKKLGNVDQVYLTGELAEGKNSPFVDLVLVGNVDRLYLYQLIEKVEPLIQKKVRVGVFAKGEFSEGMLVGGGKWMKMME
jgi:cell division protein FtsL